MSRTHINLNIYQQTQSTRGKWTHNSNKRIILETNERSGLTRFFSLYLSSYLPIYLYCVFPRPAAIFADTSRFFYRKLFMLNVKRRVRVRFRCDVMTNVGFFLYGAEKCALNWNKSLVDNFIHKSAKVNKTDKAKETFRFLWKTYDTTNSSRNHFRPRQHQ